MIYNPLSQIIKVIESMNQWVSEIMESWVTYHVTRSTVLFDTMVILLHRTQLKGGVDIREMLESEDTDYRKKDDMCQVGIGLDLARLLSSVVQAIALWDIKMAKETRSMLNTLLFHYMLLEDMVLDATGSVVEQPRETAALSMYA